MKTTVILLALVLSCACGLRPGVKAPLRLQAAGTVSQDAVDDAGDWWNGRLGCRVFDGPRGGYDVVVVDGLTLPRHVGLWTPPDLIQVASLPDVVSMHFVIIHELGHALGLVDTAHPRSIMFFRPTEAVDLMGDEEQFGAFPWVESATVDRLRAEYCAGRR